MKESSDSLLHDELHGVLKAVGLDGDEVNATGQIGDADGLGVDASSKVDILVHHHLSHDVVDADAHLGGLRGVHFDVEHVGGGVGIHAGGGHRIDGFMLGDAHHFGAGLNLRDEDVVF